MQIDSKVTQVVDVLMAARAGSHSITSLPAHLVPSSADDGYAIQAALTEALGEPVKGWKIACTNAAAQKLMQTHEPFAGPLLSSMLYTSPCELPGENFNMRMVEGEFAFRLWRDLPARVGAYTREEVSAAVDSVHPAIEIADSRYDDWLSVGLPSLIADGAVSGAFVTGEGRPWSGSMNLVGWSVMLRADGEVVGEGQGSAALGDPVSSLLWLANKLRQLGGGLKAGDIVTTGTCTGNYQAGADACVVANFGDLGEVEVQFVR